MVFSTALQKLTVCGYYCLNVNIILLQKKHNTIDVKKTSMLEIGTDVVSKVHSTRCLIWKLQLFSTITITIYTHHFLLGILMGKNTCLWKKESIYAKYWVFWEDIPHIRSKFNLVFWICNKYMPFAGPGSNSK